MATIPRQGERFTHNKHPNRTYVVSGVHCTAGFKLNGHWITDNPVIEYHQEGHETIKYGRFLGEFQHEFTRKSNG